MLKRFFLFICFAAGVPSTVLAADWPHWRGPNWDGVSAETGWSPARLKPESILWTVDVGAGYSSMAVAGGRLYTAGGKGEGFAVLCLDAVSGRQIWRSRLQDPKGAYSSGGMATPTVEGDRVYILSPGGIVYCLNAGNGSVIWKRDLVEDQSVSIPLWFFSGSVRIHGDRAVVNAGGAGIALDKGMGRVVWANADGEAGYATPVLFNAGDGDCFALFTIDRFAAVRADTGKILWTHPWSSYLHDYQADPIVMGKRVFISSAYQKGAALVDFSGGKGKAVWENKKLISNLASCVFFDGLIYGNSNPSYNPGDLDAEFFCMEAATGRKLWTRPGQLGTVIAVGDYLIRLDKLGTVTAGLRSAKDFTEAGSLKLPAGVYITPPAFSDGRLYCRTDRGSLTCVDLGNGGKR